MSYRVGETVGWSRARLIELACRMNAHREERHDGDGMSPLTIVEAALEPEADIHLGYLGAGDACQGTWRAEADRPPLRRMIASADLTTIATAAGLPADASVEKIVARVGEMRGALIEMHEASVGIKSLSLAEGASRWSIDSLARRLAEEAGREVAKFSGGYEVLSAAEAEAVERQARFTMPHSFVEGT